MTVVSIPCQIEAFYLARTTLRNADASREARTAACDVLAASTDWTDIQAVRRARHDLWATADSEKFRLLTDEEVATIFPPRPARIEADPAPAVVLSLAGPVILLSLSIGAALQFLWGAV